MNLQQLPGLFSGISPGYSPQQTTQLLSQLQQLTSQADFVRQNLSNTNSLKRDTGPQDVLDGHIQGAQVGGAGWGQLIGAGLGGIHGAINKRRFKKRRKEEYERRLQILRELERKQAAVGTQSQESLNDALGAIKGGKDSALRELAISGRGAKRRTLDREKQTQGAATQSLADRGLSSTTRGSNISRSIRSDTDRALSDIDDALSQLRSGVVERSAQREAGIHGIMANLFQNQAGQAGQLASLGLQSVPGNFLEGGQGVGNLGPILANLLQLGQRQGSNQAQQNPPPISDGTAGQGLGVYATGQNPTYGA